MSEKQINNSDQGMEKYFFRASAEDFKKIPSYPIVYWITEAMRKTFENNKRLDQIAPVKVGLQTGSNEKFVREWFEVGLKHSSFCSAGVHDDTKKWFPYNKGGAYRKWYGNNENVVNWENDGYEIQRFTDEKGKLRSRPQNREFYFRESITWSFISSSYFGVRFSDTKAIFDVAGSSAFPLESDKYFLTGLLCSKVAHSFMKVMNSTLNFQAGNVSSIPVALNKRTEFNDDNCRQLISVHKVDWNSYETSWDFSKQPLLEPEYFKTNLKETYQKIRTEWNLNVSQMQRLEETNNSFFINSYGLQSELSPEVSLKEITLTCNPQYRYGADKTEDELEALLLADTMRELVSYAVGCMFGRYSIDKPGLILANQGDTLENYLQQIPEPRFCADEDNVIPILDRDWFPDDMTGRFREFLRITFGEEYYEENIEFIEMALGKKGKRLPIGDYFLKDFYKDHVKRYKKRPIYWMFSSPNGTFNALIYLHRYSPDTVSVVLNNYMREFRNKLAARLTYLQQTTASASVNQVEKTRANNEIDTLKKQLQELDDYERDVLYPLATQQVQLDLDDGVKVNYLKLGPALKKISGLDAKDED